MRAQAIQTGEFPLAGKRLAEMTGRSIKEAFLMTTEHPSPPRPAALTVDDYVSGILGGNRTILARAITMIESNAPQHRALAEEILQKVLPHSGKAIRVGITGVPGVGKSTFIEAFGCRLCEQGHRLAVLAIDPSSRIHRGSILGDKTRMEKLSTREDAFIRPSPAGETLGGVAQKTRETIYLCEAAGYDVIFVETVGVGQSETAVRSMVDFFLLLMLSGAGDELQGMKKGIFEMADAVAITKADGDNIQRAERARVEYAAAVHGMQPATPGWTIPFLTCSSVSEDGLDLIWRQVEAFRQYTEEKAIFTKRREQQRTEWMRSLVEELLWRSFQQHPEISSHFSEISQAVAEGKLSAIGAARDLVAKFLNQPQAPS